MAEPGRATTGPTPGQPLPALVRVVTLVEENVYGVTIGNLGLIHMDPELGRRQGLAGALMLGDIRLAYLSLMLERWAGPDGRLRRLNCRYTGVDLVNDTLTCAGTVRAVERDGDRAHVICDVWVENQRGERNTVGAAELDFGLGI